MVYGQWPTFCFTFGTVLVGVVSSYCLGVSFMLWPIEAVLILVSCVWFIGFPFIPAVLKMQAMLLLFLFTRKPGKLEKGEKKPKAHKIVEVLSILYLMMHMWSGYLARFF